MRTATVRNIVAQGNSDGAGCIAVLNGVVKAASIAEEVNAVSIRRLKAA
jgi:hypothetical protein